MGSVLGIDPGGKTGIAIYDLTTLSVIYRDEVEGGIEGFIKWWNIMWGTPDDSVVDEVEDVVCEKFTLDGRTPNPDLTPKEIEGFLKGTDVHVDRFQTPAQAKALITNTVLKRAGLYPPHGQVKGGHSTDALRHALYYAVNTLKHRPTQELLWPKD